MFEFKILLLLAVALSVTITNAQKYDETKEEGVFVDQNEDISNSTDVGTSRVKHHHLPLYGGTALRK